MQNVKYHEEQERLDNDFRRIGSGEFRYFVGYLQDLHSTAVARLCREHDLDEVKRLQGKIEVLEALVGRLRPQNNA